MGSHQSADEGAYLEALARCSGIADEIEQVLRGAWSCNINAITAIMERSDGSAELDAAFDPWERLAQLRDEYDGASAKLLEAVETLKAASVPDRRIRIIERTGAELARNRGVRAETNLALVFQGVHLGMGLATLVGSPSGRWDAFLGHVARMQRSAALIPEADDPSHQRRLGLWHLFGKVLKNIKLLSGKPRAYMRIAIEQNAREDWVDWTRQGKDRMSEDSRGQRRLERAKLADVGQQAASDSGPTPLEALMLAEDEHRQEEILNTVLDGLPPDLAAIFRRWRAGESPTEARKAEGLPRSREIALRDRLRRVRQSLG